MFNTGERGYSAAEAVEGAALSLERVDHVHGGDSLALGVLCVGNCILGHIIKEHLQHPAGLLVEARDALDSSTPSQAANSGLNDALNIVSKNFTVTLGAPLSQTLSTLNTSRYFETLEQ